MKKYFFSLLVLCVCTYLTSCSEEQKKQDTPKPRVYTVAPDVMGMNITLDGRDINIVANKGAEGDDWIGQSLKGWIANNGKPYYVIRTVTFKKALGDVANNTAIQSNFIISPPRFYVNPDDLNGSYTYSAMLNMFKVGKYPMATQAKQEGYYVLFSHVNQVEPEKTFSYSSVLGSQEGSKWEIVAVQEKPNNSILVTYHIDCNVYNQDLTTKRKLIGTIQVGYTYRPFDDAPKPIGG